MSLKKKWRKFVEARYEEVEAQRADIDLKSDFRSAMIGIVMQPDKPVLSNAAEQKIYDDHKHLLNTDPEYKALFTGYSTAFQTIQNSKHLSHNEGEYYKMSPSQALWDALKWGVCGFIYHPQETYSFIKTPDKLFSVYKEKIGTRTP